MRKLFLNSAVALLSLFAVGEVQAASSICNSNPQNLIAAATYNCGFEQGSFGPWTVGGNTSSQYGIETASTGFINSGTYAAFFSTPLGDSSTPITLSQTLTGVTLAADTDYVVTFYLMAECCTGNGTTAYPANYSVSMNGTTIDSSGPVVQNGSNTWTLEWANYMTGSSAVVNPTLEFSFINEAAFFDLDDVSLAPAPEPGSLFLLAPALCLLFLFGPRIARSRA